MNPEKQDWIVFYSKEDMTTNHSLQMIEYTLQNSSLNTLEINELLEIYNIKMFLDSKLFLKSWSNEFIKMLIDETEERWQFVKRFWLTITDENVLQHLELIHNTYIRSFWKLFDYFEVFNRISKPRFSLILEKFSHHLHSVLEHKKTVNFYKNEIRIFLISYENSAEIILSKLEMEETRSLRNINLPVNLSILDKENIISNYIQKEKPNLNYLRIINYSKDSEHLKLSPRIRLNAIKKLDQMNKEMFNEVSSLNLGINITIDKNQEEPIIASNERQSTYISYSESFISSCINSDNKLSIFKYLFFLSIITTL